jgi:hypothetical protein
MSSNIIFNSPFVIEEAISKDYSILRTCFLSEGLSGNGRYYQFNDFPKIAKDLVGKVVRYGADEAGRHLKDKVYEIGEVISTWVDETTHKIMGRIKVWNTEKYPKIIDTIKSLGKGMGISVGGNGGLEPILNDGLPVLTTTGHGFLAKVVNFIVNHVQLIPANVPRGQQDAKVLDIEETLSKLELVPIEETLIVKPELEIVFTYPVGSTVKITY